MMFFSQRSRSAARRLSRRSLLLAASFLAPLALAHGDLGPPGGGAGPGSTTRGGEDGGTLPAQFEPGTGLRMVGELQELARVIRGVSGRGQVRLLSTNPTDPSAPVLLSLEGDVSLRLDRAALATGRVAVSFGTDSQFGSGLLSVGIAGQSSGVGAIEASTSLYLPLGAVYGPQQAAAPPLSLTVLSPTASAVQASARVSGSQLVLRQRTLSVAYSR